MGLTQRPGRQLVLRVQELALPLFKLLLLLRFLIVSSILDGKKWGLEGPTISIIHGTGMWIGIENIIAHTITMPLTLCPSA